MSCEEFENQLRTSDGDDLNSDLLNDRFEPINSRICIIEESLAFLGDIFGKGVFNLDSQATPNIAFNGVVGSTTDEFIIDPGAAILKGFIFQVTESFTLSFFGKANGTYYIQIGQDGIPTIYGASSTERVPLWKVDFDGSIQNIVDQRVFITNPKILLTELIESRKTNATIIGVKQENFIITANTNDIFIVSIDGKPDLPISLSAGTLSATDIVSEINTAFNNSGDYGAQYATTAASENGHIRLSSSLNGTGSVVIKTGTANGTLGFNNNETSLGIVFQNIDTRLDTKEKEFSTEIKLHKADTNIHHDKIHDINGSDHTGNLDENRITWDPVNGHNHDGVNGAKVKFTDLDITGVTNPFETTLTEAEAAGHNKYETTDPQIQQGSTYSSNSVDDLRDPLDSNLSLEDDLNQIRSIIRELKDPLNDFNITLLRPNSTDPIDLKTVIEALGNHTILDPNSFNYKKIDGAQIIPQTLSHDNLIPKIGNPHQTSLQEVKNAALARPITPGETVARIAPSSEGATNEEVLRIGKLAQHASFDEHGNITFTSNQTIDGVDISNHVTDEDAHHPKIHSHNGADGSGQLDLANLDTVNQLPLNKVNDAQSASDFATHNHDGINSLKVSFNDLNDIPTSFTPSTHTHSWSDITTFPAPSSGGPQLPIQNLEGHNGANDYNFPGVTNVNISGNFTSAGDTTLSSPGNSLTVNAATADFNSITVFNDETSFNNEVFLNGPAPTDPNHAVDKSYADTKLALSGGTMTGSLTLSGPPSSANHATTKGYVDSVAVGLLIKPSVRVATIGTLPSATYDNGSGGVGATLTADINGALPTIDGVSLNQGDRILVKDQTSGIENGAYEVTQLGDGSNPWILTRSIDFDDSPDGEVTDGSFFFVGEGTTNGDTGWVQTENEPITIGTTALSFTQFSGAGSDIIAGDALDKTGNELDVLFDNLTIGINGSNQLEVKDGSISNVKLGSGFDATKISSGLITNTEFDYLDGLTSNIQSQLNTNATAISDHVTDATDAHGASAISYINTTSGLTATDVQAAIDELSASAGGSDKVSKTGDTMTGPLVIDSSTSGTEALSVKGINAGGFAMEVDGTGSAGGLNVTGQININGSTTGSSHLALFQNNGSGRVAGFVSNNSAAAVRIFQQGAGDGLWVQQGSSSFDGIVNLNAGAIIPTGQVLSITDAPVNNTDAANKAYVDSVSGGGGGSPYFDDDGGTPAVAPSATGSGSIAIGQDITVSGNNSLGVGLVNETSTGSANVSVQNANSILLTATRATSSGNATIQTNSTNNDNSIAIISANNSTTSSLTANPTGNGSICIGSIAKNGTGTRSLQSSGTNTIAIGAVGTSSGVNPSASSNLSVSASGLYSIAIGSNASSSSTSSIALGGHPNGASTASSTACFASGLLSEASGNVSISMGSSVTASAQASMATGWMAKADVSGMRAQAIGPGGGNQGVAQYARYVQRITTSDNTTTVLTGDSLAPSSSNRAKLVSNQAIAFNAQIVALDTTSNDSAMFVRQGLISNNNGTTSFIGTVDTIGSDKASAGAGAWTVNIVANDTDDCLEIQVTGEVGKTIRWVATIQATQINDL